MRNASCEFWVAGYALRVYGHMAERNDKLAIHAAKSNRSRGWVSKQALAVCVGEVAVAANIIYQTTGLKYFKNYTAGRGGCHRNAFRQSVDGYIIALRHNS